MQPAYSQVMLVAATEIYLYIGLKYKYTCKNNNFF